MHNLYSLHSAGLIFWFYRFVWFNKRSQALRIFTKWECTQFVCWVVRNKTRNRKAASCYSIPHIIVCREKRKINGCLTQIYTQFYIIYWTINAGRIRYLFLNDKFMRMFQFIDLNTCVCFYRCCNVRQMTVYNWNRSIQKLKVAFSTDFEVYLLNRSYDCLTYFQI